VGPRADVGCTGEVQMLHVTHTTPASVVPPEDGHLTPETCRGLRHNKVIVKVSVLSWLRYCDKLYLFVTNQQQFIALSQTVITSAMDTVD
jgi:hypothetical protein